MIDLKLALRMLFKSPVVTLVAIVSLAFGIGANAAMFSLYDQILLEPLPVQEPERLVNLAAPGPKSGSVSCGNAGDCDQVFSYPMFRDLQEARSGFAGIAGHRGFAANLAYEGQTVSGSGLLVSGSYFPVLGLRPALGRLLGPEDEPQIGESRVVVLSHAYWQARFGGDPDVLNRTLIVNGQPLTIVGVAPRGFEGTTIGSRPQVFVPITLRWLLQPRVSADHDNRRSYWIYLFARREPGVSIEQAESAINLPYRTLIEEVEAPLNAGMSEATMASFKEKEIVLSEGSRGQSEMLASTRAPLMLLLGITGLVLLIACANIANLLLSRAAERRSEMAVRLSLGAGRRQLVGQLLGESCLLALLGGLASWLVAEWTLDFIAALLPGQLGEALPLHLDPTVAGFIAVVTLGTGLAFGLVPALYSTSPDLVTALKAEAGQPSGSRGITRFRTALATAQVALSMALLVLAGLFIQSLYNATRVDLGMDVSELVTFRVSPERNGYSLESSTALFERLEEELAALPGVDGVTASMVPLLSGSNWMSNVTVEGFEAGPDADTNANLNKIGPGYFRTLGIPLMSGREFTRADSRDAARVVIVNESFAEKFGLDRRAVGKRMTRGGGDGELDVEIVGLVQDARYSAVKDEVPPQFFLPYRQDRRGLGTMNFYVRSSLPSERILEAIPPTVSRLDPNLPVEGLQTMPQTVRDSLAADRVIGMLAAAFAVLATLLAAVGLYGVLAYTVSQRTREIGLRMALGATRAEVRRMVLRRVSFMVVVGGAVGLAVALAVGRMARSLLYQLQSHDPGVLLGATLALLLVALGAGLLPARRATRIDPMLALRSE